MQEISLSRHIVSRPEAGVKSPTKWSYTIDWDRKYECYVARVWGRRWVDYGELGALPIRILWRTITGCATKADAKYRAEQTLVAARGLELGECRRLDAHVALTTAQYRELLIAAGIITPRCEQ